MRIAVPEGEDLQRRSKNSIRDTGSSVGKDCAGMGVVVAADSELDAPPEQEAGGWRP